MNQLGFCVSFACLIGLHAISFDSSLLPEPEDPFARFETHAPVPFKSPLEELALVSFYLPFKHAKDAFALDQSIEPVPPIDLLLRHVESAQTVSFALVEVPLVVDSVLVETHSSAFFETVDYLASELQLN